MIVDKSQVTLLCLNMKIAGYCVVHYHAVHCLSRLLDSRLINTKLVTYLTKLPPQFINSIDGPQVVLSVVHCCSVVKILALSLALEARHQKMFCNAQSFPMQAGLDTWISFVGIFSGIFSARETGATCKSLASSVRGQKSFVS